MKRMARCSRLEHTSLPGLTGGLTFNDAEHKQSLNDRQKFGAPVSPCTSFAMHAGLVVAVGWRGVIHADYKTTGITDAFVFAATH